MPLVRVDSKPVAAVETQIFACVCLSGRLGSDVVVPAVNLCIKFGASRVGDQNANEGRPAAILKAECRSVSDECRIALGVVGSA